VSALRPCARVREQLPLFVGGDLPDQAARTVREHLRRCAPCRVLASDHLQAVRALHRAGEFVPAGVDDAFFDELHHGVMAAVASGPSRSRDLGAVAIELHTGRYAHHSNEPAVLRALEDAAHHGREIGLAVHAGHGLTTHNVGPVAAIAEIEELNIGHSIVSRAVFVGLAEAVREMRAVMDVARTRG